MTINKARRRKGRRTFGKIEQLPSGRYRASYTASDGKRRSGPTTFATMGDADAWLSTMQADMTRGTWRAPEPSRETVGAFATAWLDDGVGRNGNRLSPTTAELYDLIWRKWLAPTFGDVALGDVTVEMVRRFKTRAEKDHPGSTQPTKAYRLLRTIFNVALDDDKIAANPCRIRGGGKEPAHNERPLATEEQALAMANAVGPDYFAMVILAAWCSLRFGELAGLTRASIDPLHGKIHVRQQVVELAGGKTVIKTAKSDSGRTVEMPAAVVPVIKDHLAKYVLPDPDALVFTSPGGHRLRHTKFRLRWNQAKALAAVPIPADLTFHDLRGAGATWAAQDGATLAEIMHRLGHTTVAAAMRYQRTSADRNREIADRIGARFASAQSTVPDPDGNVVPIRRPRKAAAV